MPNKTNLMHIVVLKNIFVAMQQARKLSLKTGFSITTVYNRKNKSFLKVVHCRKSGFKFFANGLNITAVVLATLKG